jgi:hypothetical protein
MSIAENIAAGRLEQYGTWWMSDRRRDAAANDFRKKLAITRRRVRVATTAPSPRRIWLQKVSR